MEFSEIISTIIASFFAAFIGWFFGRKKNAAEVDSIELDNVDKATGIWRQLAEDLKAEIDLLRKNQQEILTANLQLNSKVTKLTVQNEKLIKEIRIKEKSVDVLMEENKKLIKKITPN